MSFEIDYAVEVRSDGVLVGRARETKELHIRLYTSTAPRAEECVSRSSSSKDEGKRSIHVP